MGAVEEEKQPLLEKKEEEKAPEPEANVEEKKETDGGEAKAETADPTPPPPPPPPEEVVMKVYMHCEACARKVKRCLRRFEGVEEVVADCWTHTVVVKGRKAAENPMKVVKRVQQKTGRKVELISPIPAPEPEKEEAKVEEPKPAAEPQVISVLLRVYMHCDSCSQVIKKRILKMKGVQEVEPDLKSSEVVVKGVFDPEKLKEYIYKRTGKRAVVVEVKQDPPPPPPEEETAKKPESEAAETAEAKPEEEKKAEEGGEEEKAKEENAEGTGEKKEEGGDGAEAAETKEKNKEAIAEGVAVAPPSVIAAAAIVDGYGKVVGVMRPNDFYCYYPKYPVEHAYPPQIFSDENPNACIVM